jgi:hypothetical protein
MALSSLGTACTMDFEEDFDTEFRVPSPKAGEQAKPYSKAKRFKMDHDPADADAVEFMDAYVAVKAPSGSDLTFLNSIEVFVCDDIDFAKCHGLHPEANLTMVAMGEGFVPGQTIADLEIVYDGDLRKFVKDNRVVLTFVVYPTAWGYNWPEDGVLIEAGVTLLITAGL